MTSDARLLNKLERLEPRQVRDMESLIDILLRQNQHDAQGRPAGPALNRIARHFGWRPQQLRNFLGGTASSLASAAVRVTRIHATVDFSLMLWRFEQATSFAVSADSCTPFTFQLVAGSARISARGESRMEAFELAAGDYFQNRRPHDLDCFFDAGAEALFFDFPDLRTARRNARRIRRVMPAGLADDGPVSGPPRFRDKGKPEKRTPCFCATGVAAD